MKTLLAQSFGIPKPTDLNEPCQRIFMGFDMFILFTAVLVLYYFISRVVYKRNISIWITLVIALIFTIVAIKAPVFSSSFKRFVGTDCL